MISPADTAYPQLKASAGPREFERYYTPTPAEHDYGAQHTRDDG